MANIFQLFGQIFIDNAEADKSIDSTTKKAEKSGSKIGSAFSSIAKGAAAVGTAVVGAAGTLGAAAYSMANNTASQADVIDKLSERTSINREELQRWMHACDQSGVKSDVLEAAIKKMSSTLDDAAGGSATSAEALTRLGIKLEDLEGLTTEQKFDKISGALADMEAGTERNALGADLFGKAYTAMLPLLNAGSEGIEGLKQEADDLGIVMSEKDVKAGVLLGDTIANVKAAFEGFKNRLGNAVIPIVQEFADMAIDALPKISELFERLEPILTDVFEKVMPPLFTLVETLFPILCSLFETLLPPITQIIESLLPVFVELIQTITPMFTDIVQSILPLLANLIESVMPMFTEIIQTVLPAFSSLISAILPTLIQIAESVFPVIIQLIESFLPPILQIVDAVLPVILELVNAILPLITQLIDSVLPIVIQLIETLLPPFEQIVDTILPLVLGLVESILPLLVQIVEAVLPILVELLDMLSPILEPLLDLINTMLAPLADLINAILTPIIELLSNLIDFIMPALQSAFKSLADFITSSFKEAFADVKKIFENYVDIFKNIIDFVKNVFAGDWESAWKNIVDSFKKIWDNLKTIVKAPINFIIKAINTLIDGINKISFDVPDWVPVIGGKTLGFDIPNIPKLRRGLDYVPRDDYPAILHKGEQVLTASEAKERANQTEKTAKEARNVEVKVDVHIEHFENSSDSDINELVDYIIELIYEKLRRKEIAFE